MDIIQLKKDIPFSELEKFGFMEDSDNCEDPEDHYYHLNNYYYPIGEYFRITVNMITRHIDILCLNNEGGLSNMVNLKPLYDLIINEMVETKN